MDLATVHRYIPSLRQISKVSKIERGYSFDGKYFLYEVNDTPSFVLRTAPLSQSGKKRKEFETVREIYDLSVKTSEPLQFGTIEALDVCYMVLRYVDGEDAADRLPALTSDQQYQVGLTAGCELRLMHQLDAPAELEPWHIRRGAKYNRNLTAYKSCGIQFSGEARVYAFIEDNLQQMKDRPNQFQHDDFHPSNLLILGENYSGVIDFNRYDWGDPFHDFIKNAYFGRQISVPFCVGQINGYFDNRVPDRFWRLYALYIAFNLYPSITWTLEVVPEQLESMKDRIATLLDDHSGFDEVIPKWYKTNC